MEEGVVFLVYADKKSGNHLEKLLDLPLVK